MLDLEPVFEHQGNAWMLVADIERMKSLFEPTDISVEEGIRLYVSHLINNKNIL